MGNVGLSREHCSFHPKATPHLGPLQEHGQPPWRWFLKDLGAQVVGTGSSDLLTEERECLKELVPEVVAVQLHW